MFSLTWLPEILLSAGLKVAETPDWRNRGRAEMGPLRGVMCHHTATPQNVGGNMPTLGLLINGRAASPGTPALSGPLAQLGLGRDGTFYVIAAGRANHAGAGRWQGFVDVGNASFIGIEAENSGLPEDVWPAIQLDAYYRGVAALLTKIGAGASLCCGHKEYATPAGRKIDPSLDMVDFRSHVASFLGGRPAAPLIPAMDAARRPTLRRGDTGDAVSEAQKRLGLAVTGTFDAGMEAALRRYQSGRRLNADGIIGPKTWQVLENSNNAPAVQPAAVAAPALAPVALPPAETENRPVTVDGLYVIGPDGTRFGRRTGLGFMTLIETPLVEWMAGTQARDVRGTDSQKRVVRAVSANEGGLEAVNSYDDAFLSFGALQWTAGANDDAGELPPLLSRFKQADAQAYADCFGAAGLDSEMAEDPGSGYFTLGGAALRSTADKTKLRTASWAYRFWRAGHHPALRACEAELALSRIERFYSATVEERPIKQWITSELGVALLLDEHVNRPSHVRLTLTTAVQEVTGALPPDPANWTTADEHKLIMAYIEARRPSSMTDSDKRANTILGFVTRNALSDARNSYAES